MVVEVAGSGLRNQGVEEFEACGPEKLVGNETDLVVGFWVQYFVDGTT